MAKLVRTPMSKTSRRCQSGKGTPARGRIDHLGRRSREHEAGLNPLWADGHSLLDLTDAVTLESVQDVGGHTERSLRSLRLGIPGRGGP